MGRMIGAVELYCIDEEHKRDACAIGEATDDHLSQKLYLNFYK